MLVTDENSLQGRGIMVEKSPLRRSLRKAGGGATPLADRSVLNSSTASASPVARRRSPGIKARSQSGRRETADEETIRGLFGDSPAPSTPGAVESWEELATPTPQKQSGRKSRTSKRGQSRSSAKAQQNLSPVKFPVRAAPTSEGELSPRRSPRRVSEAAHAKATPASFLDESVVDSWEQHFSPTPRAKAKSKSYQVTAENQGQSPTIPSSGRCVRKLDGKYVGSGSDDEPGSLFASAVKGPASSALDKSADDETADVGELAKALELSQPSVRKASIDSSNGRSSSAPGTPATLSGSDVHSEPDPQHLTADVGTIIDMLNFEERSPRSPSQLNASSLLRTSKELSQRGGAIDHAGYNATTPLKDACGGAEVSLPATTETTLQSSSEPTTVETGLAAAGDLAVSGGSPIPSLQANEDEIAEKEEDVHEDQADAVDQVKEAPDQDLSWCVLEDSGMSSPPQPQGKRRTTADKADIAGILSALDDDDDESSQDRSEGAKRASSLSSEQLISGQSSQLDSDGESHLLLPGSEQASAEGADSAALLGAVDYDKEDVPDVDADDGSSNASGSQQGAGDRNLSPRRSARKESTPKRSPAAIRPFESKTKSRARSSLSPRSDKRAALQESAVAETPQSSQLRSEHHSGNADRKFSPKSHGARADDGTRSGDAAALAEEDARTSTPVPGDANGDSSWGSFVLGDDSLVEASAGRRSSRRSSRRRTAEPSDVQGLLMSIGNEEEEAASARKGRAQRRKGKRLTAEPADVNGLLEDLSNENSDEAIRRSPRRSSRRMTAEPGDVLGIMQGIDDEEHSPPRSSRRLTADPGDMMGIMQGIDDGEPSPPRSSRRTTADPGDVRGIMQGIDDGETSPPRSSRRKTAEPGDVHNIMQGIDDEELSPSRKKQQMTAEESNVYNDSSEVHGADHSTSRNLRRMTAEKGDIDRILDDIDDGEPSPGRGSRRMTAEPGDVHGIMNGIDEEEHRSSVRRSSRRMTAERGDLDDMLKGIYEETSPPRRRSKRRMTADGADMIEIMQDLSDEEKQSPADRRVTADKADIEGIWNELSDTEQEKELGSEKQAEQDSPGGGTSRRMTAEKADFDSLLNDVEESQEAAEMNSPTSRQSPRSQWGTGTTPEKIKEKGIVATLDKGQEDTGIDSTPSYQRPLSRRGNSDDENEGTSVTSSPLRLSARSPHDRSDASVAKGSDILLVQDVDSHVKSSPAEPVHARRQSKGRGSRSSRGGARHPPLADGRSARRDSLQAMFAPHSPDVSSPSVGDRKDGVLKSCLSSKKRRKSISRTPASPSATKKVGFGSSSAAEFNRGSPSNKLTPMPSRAAKELYPLEEDEIKSKQQKDDDENTAMNTSILEDWEERSKAMELRRQLKAESAASKRGSPSPTIRRASIMVRRKSSSVASAREIEEESSSEGSSSDASPPRSLRESGLIKNLQHESSFRSASEAKGLEKTPALKTASSVHVAGGPFGHILETDVSDMDITSHLPATALTATSIKTHETPSRQNGELMGSPQSAGSSLHDTPGNDASREFTMQLEPNLHDLLENLNGDDEGAAGGSEKAGPAESQRRSPRQRQSESRSRRVSSAADMSMDISSDSGAASKGMGTSGGEDMTVQLEGTLDGLLSSVGESPIPAPATAAKRAQEDEDRTVALEPTLVGLLSNIDDQSPSPMARRLRTSPAYSESQFKVGEDHAARVAKTVAGLTDDMADSPIPSSRAAKHTRHTASPSSSSREVDMSMDMSVASEGGADAEDPSLSSTSYHARFGQGSISAQEQANTDAGLSVLMEEDEASSLSGSKRLRGSDGSTGSTGSASLEAAASRASGSPFSKLRRTSERLSIGSSSSNSSDLFSHFDSRHRHSSASGIARMELEADALTRSNAGSSNSSGLFKGLNQSPFHRSSDSTPLDQSRNSSAQRESLADSSSAGPDGSKLAEVPEADDESSIAPKMSFEDLLEFAMPQVFVPVSVAVDSACMAASMSSVSKANDIISALATQVLQNFTSEIRTQLVPETVQQMAEVMWEGVPVLQLIGSACARRPASDQESLALELHNLTDEICDGTQRQWQSREVQLLQLLSSKVAAETDAISSQRHSISQAKERIDCIDKAVHAAEAMADAEERCIKASDRVQSAISRQEKERSVLEKKLKERSEVRAQISLALEHRSRRQKVQSIQRSKEAAAADLERQRSEWLDTEFEALTLKSQCDTSLALHAWSAPLRLAARAMSLPFICFGSQNRVLDIALGKTFASPKISAAPEHHKSNLKLGRAAMRMSNLLFSSDLGIFSKGGGVSSTLAALRSAQDVPLCVLAVEHCITRANGLVLQLDRLEQVDMLECVVEHSAGSSEATVEVLGGPAVLRFTLLLCSADFVGSPRLTLTAASRAQLGDGAVKQAHRRAKSAQGLEHTVREVFAALKIKGGE